VEEGSDPSSSPRDEGSQEDLPIRLAVTQKKFKPVHPKHKPKKLLLYQSAWSLQ